MTKFEGIAIGGPRQGTQLEGYDTRLRFAKRVEVPLTVHGHDPISTKATDVDVYEFVTMHFDKGDVSYWRHEGVPSHYEALHIMLRAVEPIPDDRRQFDAAQIDAKFNGGLGYIEVDDRGRVKRLDPRNVLVRR